MTNLELTTGANVPEKTEKSTFEKYVVFFKGGVEEIVSSANKEKIEHAFDRFFDEDKDTRIKLKDGGIVLASRLTSIKPIREGTHGQDAMRKINKMLSEIPAKNEKVKWWIARIKENFERSKNGEAWIYYDKKGNTITREEADKIFAPWRGVVLDENYKVVEYVYY